MSAPSISPRGKVLYDFLAAWKGGYLDDFVKTLPFDIIFGSESRNLVLLFAEYGEIVIYSEKVST